MEARRLGIPEGELYSQLQHGKNIIIDGKIIRPDQMIGSKRPGRKIGISGDTRPTEKLQSFFKGCDLLIFESTFGYDRYQKAVESFHSTAKEAASLAKASCVGKLFLTHFSARYNEASNLVNEAREIYANVEAAEDLKVVEIPYSNSLESLNEKSESQ
jgi:ribonuclease Z